MRVLNPVVLYLVSVAQRCKKTRATSLRRPFCSLNIRPKFKMTGVSERGRRKLYFDPTVDTVSQKLAELYSLTSLFSGFFCRSNPSQPLRVYTMPLYCTCSVSQRCKKTRATSLRRPFCSLNIRPKFIMTGVSERGRRKLYFDPTVVTVSQKLAE